jgi:limonene 1,2-monooxygenase
MKFSFFMMPTHAPSENPSLAFERDISFIHLADELGFDEFFIGEHHSGGWETMPQPEMALAKASATAHRIRLGTSVTSLPFHHPFHVAERIAFLDHLTRGRAILGIGPSNLITDKRLFNMPTERLYPMMGEAADVIVRLLESADPISHDGEFWQFDNMRLQLRSYQTPRLPLAIATAGNDESLELAAKHGMILMSLVGKNMVRHGSQAEHWAKYTAFGDKHGVAASRDNWRMVTSVYLAETAEQARADVAEGIMRETEYFSSIGLKFMYESTPGQPFSEFTPESCAETREWIIGTPDDAIAWIEARQKLTGGFGGMMLTTHEWTRTDKLRRSMEMFARYVMPHFRGHTATYRDEWRRIQDAAAEGGLELDVGGRPSNLQRR